MRAALIAVLAAALAGCSWYIDDDDGGNDNNDNSWSSWQSDLDDSRSCFEPQDCELIQDPCTGCIDAVNTIDAPRLRRDGLDVDCADSPLIECEMINAAVCTPVGECRAIWGDAPPDSCNPVLNDDCDTGEKCSLAGDPLAPMCVPDGTVTTGSCSIRPDGADDCRGPGHCYLGESRGWCLEMCETDLDCESLADTTCLTHSTFPDGLGMCHPTCDPLAPDCDAGMSCYLSFYTNQQFCGVMAETGTQGEYCERLTGCSDGYSCVLWDNPTAPGFFTCAFICDATGGGGPSCLDDGPGAGYRCQAVNTLYPESAEVPSNIGACVPDTWPEPQ